MKTQHSPRHPSGFTAIEAFFMIIALVLFSLVAYSIYKKDFMQPSADKPATSVAPKAAAEAPKVAPPATIKAPTKP
jgi:hypothetical protein